MKVRFAALAAFLLTGTLPQLGLRSGRPQASPTFKSRSLGYPELELAPLLRKNENIGGGGSIASTFGKGNTSFVTGWPICRPIANSEEDWSTGFAKCITSESSSAGAADSYPAA